MAKGNAPVTAAQVIRKRRSDLLFRRELLNTGINIAGFCVILVLIFTQIFMLRQTQGNDMFPTIKDGDLLLAYRLESSYDKDEVVIYHAKGEVYVGRIIARGGDTVTLGSNGTVYVNNATQSSDIMYSTYEKEGIVFPYTVPQGSFFILSDYRTQGVDSRDFGAVEEDDIYGKVITVLRRREI